MTDERDFLERTQSLSEKMNGSRASVDDLANNFALYGPEKRIAALEQFDAELASSDHRMSRRTAEKFDLRRKMGVVHSTLQKVGR